MRKQSPIALFFLILFTLGIYGIVWLARTRGEMNRLGADIPTTWLIIVPIANIWYLWKWSQGVEHVTNEKMSGILTFILVWLLGGIGYAIVQDSFNNVSAAPASAESVSPAAQAPQAGSEASQTPEVAPATEATEQPATESASVDESSEEQKPMPQAPAESADATSSEEQPPKEGETL